MIKEGDYGVAAIFDRKELRSPFYLNKGIFDSSGEDNNCDFTDEEV